MAPFPPVLLTAAVDLPSMPAPVADVVACGGLLILAAAAHWLLRRIERRAPVALARAGGSNGVTGNRNRWQRPIELALVLPKMAVWVAAVWVISGRFAVLRMTREDVLCVIRMGLASPLFALNDMPYSALDVLALPALLAAVWLAATAFTRLVTLHILRAAGADRGLQESVATVTRYILTFLGAVVLLQWWGVDIRSIAIGASVLGVGIGFGLQNIANNFISGLLLSFERPIKPGDFVKLGDFVGTVERIGGRSTEIRTRDQVSILVPNSRFLEHEVINWTHGDPVSRVHVPIGVAYGSDVGRVRNALLEAARSHPDVLRDPRPEVELRRFGDSTLDFELLVWIADPRIQFRLQSDLNYRIVVTLQQQGIEIPFPQRDLHLKSPQLDRIVAALGKQLMVEETRAGNGDATPEMDSSPSLDFGPRPWSDEELRGLVERMRAEGGVPIADRRHLLSTYPRCFIGREAVDWLQRTEELTRGEATALGQVLLENGHLHHVLDEHRFEDGNFFYRFFADERQ